MLVNKEEMWYNVATSLKSLKSLKSKNKLQRLYGLLTMSLFSHHESYLGVDIGANGIKLVELRKSKGRPQLWTYGMVDEPLDIHLPDVQNEKGLDELISEDTGKVIKNKKIDFVTDLNDPRVQKYAAILKELVKRSKVTTNRVTASLPVSYIFHAVLNLPVIDEKEINSIVKAEVKKMLPRPIEEMQVVHQLIPETDLQKQKKYLRFLVTAAPKSLVAFYTAIFRRAGLQLQELETEAFALERSLVGRDSATVMVVDIGAERTNFFIINQGLPITHRSINVGGNTIDSILKKNLGISSEDVEQVKRDISRIKEDLDSQQFVSIVDPIEKEIEYGFDLFLHQTGNENMRPEKIIFTGGSGVMPFIVNHMKSKFNMKVFVGDPWARVVYQEGLRKVLDEVGPRLAVSIGLAMRNIFDKV